jgi:hypothetical protein
VTTRSSREIARLKAAQTRRQAVERKRFALEQARYCRLLEMSERVGRRGITQTAEALGLRPRVLGLMVSYRILGKVGSRYFPLVWLPER